MALVSDSVLEARGFRKLAPDEKVTGCFFRIEIFQIRGLKLDTAIIGPLEGVVNESSYKLAAGANLNEVCRNLTGHDFTNDEKQWKKDNHTADPFLAILLGPTDEYVSNGNHVQEDGAHIYTYDSFGEAQLELRRLSDAVLPSIISELSFSLSNSEHVVRLVPVKVSVAGTSADGRLICDTRIQFHGEAYVSINTDEKNVRGGLAKAIENAASIHPRVAEFSFLAFNESDPLKRFLYFFLALERLIHSTFDEINRKQKASALIKEHKRIERHGTNLLDNFPENLANKFIYCAMHEWQHLNDNDVDKFLSMKKVRDKIAHGDVSVPKDKAVAEVEALVFRIQNRS